jgi:hypothetical protein
MMVMMMVMMPGGNNFYGADIAPVLAAMAPSEREAWVLMQRIFPPPQRGVLLRAATAHEAMTVSELGIFSTFLGDGSQELLNEVGDSQAERPHAPPPPPPAPHPPSSAHRSSLVPGWSHHRCPATCCAPSPRRPTREAWPQASR